MGARKRIRWNLVLHPTKNIWDLDPSRASPNKKTAMALSGNDEFSQIIVCSFDWIFILCLGVRQKSTQYYG